MRHAPSLALSVIGAFLLWGVARADQINFKADLSGASEVPTDRQRRQGYSDSIAGYRHQDADLDGGLFGPQRSADGWPYPRPGCPGSERRCSRAVQRQSREPDQRFGHTDRRPDLRSRGREVVRQPPHGRQ